MDLAVSASTAPQAEERVFRDRAAGEQLKKQAPDLLKVAQHHHAPVMQEYAGSFRLRFSETERILDIGIGYAWHWKKAGPGPSVIGIDLSLGNLLLAKQLLGKDSPRVFLVCADAAHLPFSDGSIDGVWSVQAFQHFPESVFHRVQIELDRVLKKRFQMELHHLHPALLYRILCRLLGRRLHRRGRLGPFETHRLFLSEWLERWASFRGGSFQASTGYSELFFHPELRWRPRPYPSRLELFLSRCAPGLAALFARQGVLRLDDRTEK